MQNISFTEFRKNASFYINLVEEGEDLVVLKHGRAVAQIKPFPKESSSVPSWKRPALRLKQKGLKLSQAILEERE